MIIADIDVTRLDKQRFREGKNGQKYCDLVFIDHPKDKSDGFVKQGVSKEEREARVEMPIIGNWRRVGGEKPAQHPPRAQGLPQRPQTQSQGRRPSAPPPRPPVDTDLDTPEEDIPFKTMLPANSVISFVKRILGIEVTPQTT